MAVSKCAWDMIVNPSYLILYEGLAYPVQTAYSVNTWTLWVDLPQEKPRGWPDDAMIVSHQGKPWRSGAAFAYWWYHEVGDPLLALGVISKAQRGIQNLKRYAISRLLGLGLDVETIRSITGHRTPAVILRYARTNEERQRTAINALAASMLQNGSTPVAPKTPPQSHRPVGHRDNNRSAIPSPAQEHPATVQRSAQEGHAKHLSRRLAARSGGAGSG